MPSISVLMPVRNAASTVVRAVESILAQTCRDWELLAVDDASTDGTRERLHLLERLDSRIRVMPSEGRGIVAALSAGMTAARGEFIARMDADDEAHPDRLAEQLGYLRTPAHASIGVVSCLVEFGGDPQSGEGYARHVHWLNSLVTPEAIALNRFIESPLAHPSVMFRRKVVQTWGSYREGNFPEDYELWLRWMDAGVGVAKVPRLLLRWNDPPQRLSRIDARYEPEAFFRLKAEWIARWLARTAAENRVDAREQSDGRMSPARRDILVWGAGRPTRKRAAHLQEHGVRIAGYVDVDAKKITRALGGTGSPVITPGQLPTANRPFVLGYVASRGARELIRAELRARGYEEGRDFLMCA